MAASFTLFGSIQVHADNRTLRERDFGGRKPKQLLEILLLQEGRYLAKEQLADMLWGDRVPANVASTIEHYVSLVRKRLRPGGKPQDSLLMTGHGGYRIDCDRVWLDIVAFEQLADRAAASANLDTIEQALELVTGELVEDEPYAEWAIKARAYYGQRHQRLLLAGSDAALTRRSFTRARELAESALRADPLAEEGYRLLMKALYGAGKQQEALVAYRTCQRTLVEEAGLEPMHDTAALHEAILKRVPAGDLLPTPAARPIEITRREAPAPASPFPQTNPPAGARPLACAVNAVGPAASPLAQATAAAALIPPTVLPLLGRSAELAHLLALCTQSAPRGGTQSAPRGGTQSAPRGGTHGGFRGSVGAAGEGLPTVVVEGEAGVGKTRLLDEVAVRLADRPIVRLRCSELESALRGALISDVVRALTDDPNATSLVVEAVNAPDWTAGGARAVVLEAICSLLRKHPTAVIMVDDAQWADPDSVALLVSAARRCGDAGPGAVIFAGRSEDMASGHPLARLESAARIRLVPLTPSELATHGGLSLHAQTGGLPLYVVNWLSFTLGDDLAMPETLRRVVLTQCHRLGDDLLRVAAVAAGVPPPCGPEEVGRLLGRDALTVADHLERLAELGVVRVEGRGFDFRYDVVREVLWETVSPARRRLLSGRHRGAAAPADRRTSIMVPPPGSERRIAVADRRGDRTCLDVTPRRDLRLAAGRVAASA